MKNRIKKSFCIIFALTLILSTVFSSSCASEKTENTEGKLEEATDQLEDTAESEEDVKLPFEPTIIDLGGRAFTFADCGWGAETTSEQRDVLAEEEPAK